MRKIVLVLFLGLLFPYVSCKKENIIASAMPLRTFSPLKIPQRKSYSIVKVPQATLMQIFNKKSGTVGKADAMLLLGYLSFNDSLKSLSKVPMDWSRWDEISQKEIVGKYYKDNHRNMYHAYIENEASLYSGVNLVLEIDMERSTICFHEFCSSNYNCCSDNMADPFEGFRKVGDYYYIKICGTGSGHCSAWFYLFKDFSQIGNCISESVENVGIPNFARSQYLTSEMRLAGDEVYMKYVLKEADVNYNGDKLIEKNKTIKRYNIKYSFQQGGWVANDSTLFKEENLQF